MESLERKYKPLQLGTLGRERKVGGTTTESEGLKSGAQVRVRCEVYSEHRSQGYQLSRKRECTEAWRIPMAHWDHHLL